MPIITFINTTNKNLKRDLKNKIDFFILDYITLYI